MSSKYGMRRSILSQSKGHFFKNFRHAAENVAKVKGRSSFCYLVLPGVAWCYLVLPGVTGLPYLMDQKERHIFEISFCGEWSSYWNESKKLDR